MSIKEGSLVTVSEAEITGGDYVRVLDGDNSRKITVSDFADVMNPLLVALGFLNSTGSGSGKLFGKVTTVTSNYGVLDSDNIILCNTTAGVVSITLPTAASAYTAANQVGQVYTVKRITTDANKVSVIPPGAETIDGNTSYDLVGPNLTSITFVSNGTNWFIID